MRKTQWKPSARQFNPSKTYVPPNGLQPQVKHKFNAKPQNVDGIHFSSKKEAIRYADLRLFEMTGEVLFFLRQVPLHLPGGVKYVCDFQVFWADGTVTFEDVKGMKTPLYIAKKKIVEEIYPIEITEI